MFKFLFKPTIKATLIKNGTGADITTRHINSRQVFLLLYLLIKQLAKDLGMDTRQLINRVVDLDKQLIKTQKAEKKEAYRQKHLNK